MTDKKRTKGKVKGKVETEEDIVKNTIKITDTPSTKTQPNTTPKTQPNTTPKTQPNTTPKPQPNTTPKPDIPPNTKSKTTHTTKTQPKTTHTQPNTQKPPKTKGYRPEVLVLGPGAEKGYYELGALLKLEKEGSLDDVKYISCCSAGSIIGIPFSVGYTISELVSIFMKNDTFSVLGNIKPTNIFNGGGGLFGTEGLKKLLKGLLKKKLGYVPNMKSLYLATGIEITIISTDLNSKDCEKRIDHLGEPDLNCIDAVLLSSALPVILDGLEYRGNCMVDGAFANCYPIDVYDDGKRECLGIYIDDQVYKNKVNNNFEKIDHIMHCLLDDKRERNIRNSTEMCYHLGITKSDKVKNHFNPDESDKKEMIRHGMTFATDFLNKMKDQSNYSFVKMSKEGVPILKYKKLEG